MRLINEAELADYGVADPVMVRMNCISKAEDEDLVCQRWLRQSLPKRHIFHALYSDLLNVEGSRRIADVGGGLNAFSRELASRHDYALIDLLAHEGSQVARTMSEDVGKIFLHRSDWYSYQIREKFDVVIANDIFPNVDQRLELFLEKFLPCAKQIRLSLTFYDLARFYVTRRVDGDEFLCMLAWSSKDVARVLAKYSHRIVDYRGDLFDRIPSSVFPNGRGVCLVEIRGDA